jgi:hypothetical protein
MTPDQITPDSLLNVRWMDPLIKTLYQALEKLNAPDTVKRALTDSGDLGHVAWWISTLPSVPVEPVPECGMEAPRLSLRDWLAVTAKEEHFQRFLSRLKRRADGKDFLMTAEEARYAYADAMMVAREGGMA